MGQGYGLAPFFALDFTLGLWRWCFRAVPQTNPPIYSIINSPQQIKLNPITNQIKSN